MRFSPVMMGSVRYFRRLSRDGVIKGFVVQAFENWSGVRRWEGILLGTTRVNLHLPRHAGANFEVGFIQYENNRERSGVSHGIAGLPANP